MRVLHKVRSPEYKKPNWTERELCILSYYAGYPLRVDIPKRGRKKIYKGRISSSTGGIFWGYRPLSYSWFLRNPLANEESIDWSRITLNYL